MLRLKNLKNSRTTCQLGCSFPIVCAIQFMTRLELMLSPSIIPSIMQEGTSTLNITQNMNVQAAIFKETLKLFLFDEHI